LKRIIFILVGMITTKSSKEVIRELEAAGWYLVRVKGSHHQFKHPQKLGLVTVKHPAKCIPVGTLLSIARQAGWRP
jgi:predicted RNA binding protein YcfA (HicA-like mRNA interferase family)